MANPTDTSGNIAIDFVHGNLPIQPNDLRTGSGAQVVVANNATQNVGWSGYSVYPSSALSQSRFTPTLNNLTGSVDPDSHIRVAQNWDNYPTNDGLQGVLPSAPSWSPIIYKTGSGVPTSATVTTIPNVVGKALKYAVEKIHDAGNDIGTITYSATGAIAEDKRATVTAASASAGTVTYTAANSYVAGQIVSIVGLSTAAFNLSNVIIATASSTQFTVTNAATGTAVTGATATASVLANTLTVSAQSAVGASTQGAAVNLTLWRWQDASTPGVVVPSGYVAG